MDSLFSFCKENYQLICLFISIIGVLVGIISVVYEMKKKKQKKDKDIKNN